MDFLKYMTYEYSILEDKTKTETKADDETLSKSLYLANDEKIDKILYEKLIPAFAANNEFNNISLTENKSFSYYDDLSDNVKKMFRDLFYEQCKELECTKEEFEELYCFLEFVCYLKKEFLPIFRRYLHKNSSDKEFMKKTARIHEKCKYVEVNWEEYINYIINHSKYIDFTELDGETTRKVYRAINGRKIPTKREIDIFFKLNWDYL